MFTQQYTIIFIFWIYVLQFTAFQQVLKIIFRKVLNMCIDPKTAFATNLILTER